MPFLPAWQMSACLDYQAVDEDETKSDRSQKLIEVVSMIEEFAVTLEEAEAIVCVTVGNSPFPTKRVFCQPPEWLAELCDEVQGTWTPAERRRRAKGMIAGPWEAPDIDTSAIHCISRV